MVAGSVTVEAGGERLTLLPSRAAWLAREHTLLVADVHIGKAMSFRRLGVPVPKGTTAETLDTLSALVHATGAQRLVVLGDLMHSSLGMTPATREAFARWRGAHASLTITLVNGNHDARAGAVPAEWKVDAVREPLRVAGGALALAHEPVPVAGAYVLAGHLHPCVTLSGRAMQRLRLPCFHFADAVGVLPAFGAFTGMHPVRPVAGERVFVVADGLVRERPLPAARPRFSEPSR